MRFGIGIDMIDIARIKNMVKTTSFLDKCFSQREKELFNKKGRSLYQTVAGNFCAKEAFVKALGTGLVNISLIEIEVLRDEKGKPYLKFNGSLAVIEKKAHFDVSITHTDAMAAATVLVRPVYKYRKKQKETTEA
jgi:holo-[acyl-carrier protein] synthase